MVEAGLTAVGLSRRFRSAAGVHGVDLRIEPGEIHALVGLNGAGKSTFMKLVLGLLRPDTGTVAINGVDVHDAPAMIWARVGHLVEHPLAYPELTTRANLALGARLHAVEPDQISSLVECVLDELALRRYANVRARVLSSGNRQRLGLASALQHNPSLIVLDEPTNALDPAGVILLREALLRRARGAGAAVLVSSHHLDEVARSADRISVLNEGRIIGGLDPGGVDIERAFFALIHADTIRADTACADTDRADTPESA
ncbi:MAG: ABC transporter ATP-binding protein [Actinomycetota bacterium]|nr:ABC transporter ATP-binding protein [Actinomycetota bacterium]